MILSMLMGRSNRIVALAAGLAACGTVTEPGEVEPIGTFTLAADPPRLLVREGGVAVVQVTLERSDGVASAVDVTVDGLPAGVAHDPLTIAPTDTEGTLVFRADPDALQGAVELTASAAAILDPAVTSESAFRLLVAGRPGTLDQSFATGGKLVYGDELTLGRAVGVQADGAVLVTGSTAVDALILRLLDDGSLDPSFGTGGEARSGIGTYSEGLAVAELSDGRIVVSGVTNGGGPQYDFGLHAFNADGSPDNAFGDAGIASFSPSDGLAELLSVDEDPDGNLLVAGTDFAPPAAVRALRYSPGGVRDMSYDVSVPSAFAGAAVVQPDGKLVVAGFDNGSNNARVWRFNTSGGPDTTFGTGGSTEIDLGTGDRAQGLSLLPDGSFLVVGTADGHAVLAHLGPGGQPDNNFGVSGVVVTTLSMFSASPNAAAVDSEGRILFVGSQDEVPAVARFHPDGSRDWEFGDGGVAVIDFGVEGAILNRSGGFGIALDQDGRIVFSGEDGTSQRMLVGRLWP